MAPTEMAPRYPATLIQASDYDDEDDEDDGDDDHDHDDHDDHDDGDDYDHYGSQISSHSHPGSRL